MDQLDEIRSKIDLVQLVSEYLSLQKSGRNFKTACPFHSEKTPSFMISPERQIWKCFGCGLGGDVFRFLMEYEKMDFGEALRFLAKRAGVVLKSYRPSEDESKKEKLYQVNHLAAEYYHYLLLNHPAAKKALNYVLQRGISKDSLKLFKIGFAPDLWEGLQKYLVGKKGFGPEDLEKAGLVIPRQQSSVTNRRLPVTFYDRFRNRLMFPLFDHRGNICGFAGRVLDTEVKDLPAGRQEAKYINTPETLIYHKSDLLYPLNLTKEAIKKNNRAVIVEGELDAISSFQIGIKEVVAIKGSALTLNQVKLIKRFSENLVLALDTDLAGDSAARRGIEIADKEGLNIRVLTLKKFKDPDEAAQKDPGYYKERLKEVVPFYEYLINSAIERLGVETPEGKRKVAEEIVPVLARIENEIIKNHYVRMFSLKLAIAEEAVLGQIRKAVAGWPSAKPTETKPPEIKTRRQLLEEHLLALYFQGGRTEEFLNEESESFESPAYKRIIQLFGDFSKSKKGKPKGDDFFTLLPEELREIFNNFYLIDLGSKIEEDSWVSSEIGKTKKEIEILKVKAELIKSSEEIKKLESEAGLGSQAWEKAQGQFKALSEKLDSI